MSGIQLIQHNYENSPFYQRATDGYINATLVARAAKKEVSHFIATQHCRDLVDVIAADRGIPRSAVLQVIKGGTPALQGTWIHPYLAIHFASWCSANFGLLVSKVVVDWFIGQDSVLEAKVHEIDMNEVLQNLDMADSLMQLLLEHLSMYKLNEVNTLHLSRQIQAIQHFQKKVRLYLQQDNESLIARHLLVSKYPI